MVRRPLSIRLRLTLLFTAVLAGTLLIFGIVLHALLARTLVANGDNISSARAQAVARDAIRFAPDGTMLVSLRPAPPRDLGRPFIFIQVFDLRSRQIAGRSPNLDEETLPITPRMLAAAQQGEKLFETVRIEEQRIRVFSLPVIVNGAPVAVVQVGRSLALDERLLGPLRWLLAVLAGVGLPTAAGLGWLLAGRALAPIRVIADTAGEIGRARDFSRRVSHGGPPDELEHLAGAINVMLDHLEQAHRDLEQALAAQRRFVASASHELRTPLTTIRLNAEMLEARETDRGSERATMLADIAAEADRLGRLVNNLLVLARADAGWRPTLRPTPLRPIVEDAFRQAQVLTEGRALDLVAPRDVSVSGDPDLLKQLLLILLDNAFKYTPSGGRVTVTLGGSNGAASFSVADSGPGIAAEDIPRIFDRFYRADSARQVDGSGLGLSIAKWIVEQHGARIDVASQVGRGTTFTVRFPN